MRVSAKSRSWNGVMMISLISWSHDMNTTVGNLEPGRAREPLASGMGEMSEGYPVLLRVS